VQRLPPLPPGQRFADVYDVMLLIDQREQYCRTHGNRILSRTGALGSVPQKEIYFTLSYNNSCNMLFNSTVSCRCSKLILQGDTTSAPAAFCYMTQLHLFSYGSCVLQVEFSQLHFEQKQHCWHLYSSQGKDDWLAVAKMWLMEQVHLNM
jgi:hypothetical protein